MTAPPSSSRGGGDPVQHAPSKHGDSPTSDGAVGGTLGDSKGILMGAYGAFKIAKNGSFSPGSIVVCIHVVYFSSDSL